MYRRFIRRRRYSRQLRAKPWPQIAWPVLRVYSVFTVRMIACAEEINLATVSREQ